MTSSDNTYQFYRYVPSLPAAIVSCVVFGILTIGHCFRMIRCKTWFCIPFVLGGLFEFIGYIGRILGHYDKQSLGPYIIQTLLILLAPALFAASIYMTLGKIITALDAQDRSFVPAKWQTKLFVIGDVVSFLAQVAGGGLQASKSESSRNVGDIIVVVGLFIQVVFFGVFVITSVLFNRRLLQQPTTRSIENSFPWQRLLFGLYAVSLLIFIRSIFRVVEYIQGNAGYLLRHEIYTYIFDALLMALCMAIFLFYHPSRIQTRKDVPLRSLQSKHMEGQITP